jgi:hypothetical protein
MGGTEPEPFQTTNAGFRSKAIRIRRPSARAAPPNPAPATETPRAGLTHPAGEPPAEMSQSITDLAAAHRTFAERLADRQSPTIPVVRATPGWVTYVVKKNGNAST